MIELNSYFYFFVFNLLFFNFIEYINIVFKNIRNYVVLLGRNEFRELFKMLKFKLWSISFKYMKNKGNVSLGILF